MTSHQGLLIKDGAITRVQIGTERDGASSVHGLIGDFFSTCFNVPGNGRHRLIVGYCDDLYLTKSRAQVPWNVFLDPHSLYKGGWPVAGPIVVCAHIAPDTVSMSEAELSAFHVVPPLNTWIFQNERLTLPILTYRPHYDTP
ncbi:MAG TPA: hypothetical protein VH539_10370 [Gemmatimonadaceae bacterium]|jgi:hypothetical protein